MFTESQIPLDTTKKCNEIESKDPDYETEAILLVLAQETINLGKHRLLKGMFTLWWLLLLALRASSSTETLEVV